MEKVLLTGLLIAGTIGLMGCEEESQRRDEAQALYLQNCASCHAADLSGGSGSSLLDDEWTYGSSDEEIAAVIRNGIPDMGMPPWDAALSDDQIRALVIYIREQRASREDALAKAKFESSDGIYEALGTRYQLETLHEIEGVLWSMDFMPDGSLLVTQRDGKLWHFAEGTQTLVEGTPQVWAHGQGGLLEVQLHPDYADNGWIYLSFSENTGAKDDDKDAGMTAVVRGRIQDNRWADEEKIFSIDGALHISSGAHFGSRFVFDQGYLYFSIGDRGRQQLAQDLSKPSGKIFRIFDDGRIPADNPFVDEDGALPAIWSYGHRNPQGMDIDPATGLIWETEHGPRGGDELNLVEKGKNYGWPVITYGMNYDGTPITSETHRDGMEQPVHYWVPSIATSGIEFYRGSAFPDWAGKLLVTGMASNELRLLTIDNGELVEDALIMKGKGRVRDVATGPDGAIYVLLGAGSPTRGTLARLVPVE